MDTQKKLTKKENCSILVLLLIGLLILFYPSLSQTWNGYRESRLAQTVTSSYQQLTTSEKKTNLKQVREYNASLVGGIVPNVFALREGKKDATYEALLNPNQNGVMATIEIPKIDVKIPIYHYSSAEVLEKGCGHIFGSSLPIGGESTHAVLTAHRGVPTARLFTDLDLLAKDDQFFVSTNGETLAYQIDQIEVVEPQNTKSLAVQVGEDYVTLVTCTPYGINTKRLLVRGVRVPYLRESYTAETKKVPHKGKRVLARIICIGIGFLLASLVTYVSGLVLKNR